MLLHYQRSTILHPLVLLHVLINFYIINAMRCKLYSKCWWFQFSWMVIKMNMGTKGKRRIWQLINAWYYFCRPCIHNPTEVSSFRKSHPYEYSPWRREVNWRNNLTEGEALCLSTEVLEYGGDDIPYKSRLMANNCNLGSNLMMVFPTRVVKF